MATHDVACGVRLSDDATGEVTWGRKVVRTGVASRGRGAQEAQEVVGGGKAGGREAAGAGRQEGQEGGRAGAAVRRGRGGPTQG